MASGSLKVFLYEHVLALFSSEPYHTPSSMNLGEAPDLRPHLTNTCLQEDGDEDNVRLLEELIGSSILSSPDSDMALTQDDVLDIMKQMKGILCETFTAALAMPVHFQVIILSRFYYLSSS